MATISILSKMYGLSLFMSYHYVDLYSTWHFLRQNHLDTSSAFFYSLPVAKSPLIIDLSVWADIQKAMQHKTKHAISASKNSIHLLLINTKNG